MKSLERFPSSLRTLALVAVFSLAALPVPAQEGEHEGHGMPMEHAAEMSAEEAAMMESWMKAMAVGPQHAMLAEGAGEWRFALRAWMEPGGEPMVSEGVAVRSMELGGRVSEEVVTSSFMGMPFEGIGRTGYDNVTGKWWSTWTDNMSTGLMVMTGTWDEAAKSWTFTGEMADPMTGEQQAMKMVVQQESKDRELVEMWQAGPDGEMVKTMEMVYER